MNNQPHGPPGFDRERERELEEQHRQQRVLQQQEELAQREREHNERQERERQHREQYQPAPPHQTNTSGITIHQPQASRLPGAIHSPGGLLANHGGAPSSGPLGAPSGPGNTFGGPLHNDPNRSIQHNPQAAAGQLQQQQGFPPPNILHHNPVGGPGPAPVAFGGPLQQQQQQQDAVSRLQQALPFGGPIPQGHQMPGAPALGQGGQQPILNDALSYLDQVKVQFADQPDVYNRFLDIMKDFKSQAIDTPGVINRVSELFAGHPNLIQGFNTFLPPGYRIECGAGNDPNTIRVTTPMGTTVQSITGAGRALPDSAIGQGGGFYGTQRAGGWQQPQHSIESPEGVFSPPNQGSAAPLPYNQTSAQHSAYEQAAAAAAHQQQQRGVSQLTNAAGILGHPPRNTQTPTPGGQAGMNGGSQPGLEKRGPVEFNHAISYVNKIKNRFQDRPEIYKQFLEILQTYQRESKPIQDVYAQVTTLFNTAPDLLEDFKQFLPESAAQAKAAAAAKAMEEAQQNQTLPPHSARGETKMPPVGNFAVPASTGKDSKKRPRNSTTAGSGSQVNIIGESSSRGVIQTNQPNKRAKLNHKQNEVEAQAVAPTLTPVMPEPMPPTYTSGATQEELSFFDRIKKYIGNKSTTNEFLKLCNLFSQDLIDKTVLVNKVSNFIGGNPDLMNHFRAMVIYDSNEEEDIVENLPKAPTGRVALSNCRGLGPSYRLLPKRERLKPCSGRDEMCQQVLNDDWASHPTWASEDSGFVAHRKNVYEEGLHRVEEERHDYDFNIEANAKVIQLLEPIAQTILAMTPEEREGFRMPIGLGGQSQSIYKRVLKKVYGERGPGVAADLFKDPCAVIPTVLGRLKQKDEEWRFTQREWEKVWRSQTASMYLRSLDHMGIQVKQADKRNFSAKHLIDSIKTKHEEQKRQRNTKGKASKYQFTYEFSDQDVITDVLRFMILYATNASQHNSPERRRIAEFFRHFTQVFFGISEEIVLANIVDLEERGSPEDEEESAPMELTNGRGRRPGNGKKTGLLHKVLDKGRNGKARASKEDSATGSKESTPDVDSVAEDEGGDATEDQVMTEVTNERWLSSLPQAIEVNEHGVLSVLNLDADQPFPQTNYKLYCNQTIYVFFSIFQTLYRRLKEIKECEEEAREEGVRANKPKPAREIGLLQEREDYYAKLNGESYYSRTLALVEDFITGEVEEANYHNSLRQYYLKKGWQLFTIQDLLKHLCRLGAVCSSVDTKEKTPDILEQFYRNRQTPETTFNTQINIRKQTEKYIKDGELFIIQWDPSMNEARLRWMTRDETTFDLDDMERKQVWQYYVSSLARVEPTEGIPRGRMRKVLLTRNISLVDAETDETGRFPTDLAYKEDLIHQVDFNSYKMIYKKEIPSSDWFIWGRTAKPFGGYQTSDTEKEEPGKTSLAEERLRKVTSIRNERFKVKFVLNNDWMRDKDREEVDRIKGDFRKWIGGDEGIKG